MSSISSAITAFRNELLAEHLATSPDAVAAALFRAGGSLVLAIEALRRGTGRTLVPIAMPFADDTPLATAELFDPEKAEPLWSMLIHAVRDRFNRTKRGKSP
jgi:hypothetical protein